MKININDIEVDESRNCRQSITGESVHELAASMLQFGQDTPVIVKPHNGKYRLIAGYRRLAAANILNWTEVEATVRDDLSESEADLLCLRENVERENLSYFDECCYLKKLFPPETTLSEMARATGRSRCWCRVRFKFWDLEPEIILEAEMGRVGPSDVQLLLAHSPEERVAAAQQIQLAKQSPKPSQPSDLRSKQQLLLALTIAVDQERPDAVAALRWALGQIESTNLFGEHRLVGQL